ncbi:hypothetical protein [Nocardia crassostreae]|uniref:hypothetical protein n=1 Tax=Nocardia crassostreae TaxID=53428 RepID=UPI000829F3AA|nr:hypothetical protein [Nocardia crassostreae]
MSDATNHDQDRDTAPTREIVAAAASEVRVLAERAEGSLRKRLLVVAHVLELAGRELSAVSAPLPDTAVFAREIRSGAHDQSLIADALRLREKVRRAVSVVHPGYDRTARR